MSIVEPQPIFFFGQVRPETQHVCKTMNNTDGVTEITYGEKQTHQHTLKIDDFNKFIKLEDEIITEYIDVFNGRKIAFKVIPYVGVVKSYAPKGGDEKRISTTDKDKFFYLRLVSTTGFVPHSLAGRVEITVPGGTGATFSLGSGNEKYHKFDFKNEIEITPGNVSYYYNSGSFNNSSYISTSEKLTHVKLTEKDKNPIEIKFTLFYIGESIVKQKEKMPDSLMSSKLLSDLTMKIMNDESTSDLKITCGKKDNKKIFKVHKSFLCAISPVFKAAIESDMLEGITSEIYIEAGVGYFLVSSVCLY